MADRHSHTSRSSRSSRSVSRSSSHSGRSRSHSRSRRHRRHRRHHHSRSPRRRGSRSYSRSRSHSHERRSRSHSYSRGRHRRSRSRSHSRGRRSPPHYRRHYSRSPLSHRKRHAGNRDDPTPSRCLGVFGLSLYTTERELKDIFSKYGPIEDVQVVYDRQTGRSRGFAFVYFDEMDDAREAKERTNGVEVDGRRMRVDFSITKRPHTPTPGIYMGKPTRSREADYDNSHYSPPPYGSKRRSRSPSYSPRRY